MTPSQPDQLGPYPIEHELGRGGMGVVYLGRDPRLNRQVAIKVLADQLSGDAEHLARFRREATLLASVSHPNVAAVYGVEDVETEAGPRQLLVLEYVPGETLAAHIARGPLPLHETLDICRQIAAGLEAAHERGVIHRDLKPGNVKITPDGIVKVLDFGLARGDVMSGSSADGLSPTLTYSPTGLGVILGTAGYMSPEQARGKPVDRRTDVWALGCVLYECLTGRRAFDGETVSDTIAAILAKEPDWSALPAGTPPRLVELLQRCLERDPRKRRRDIGDVGVQLDEIARQLSAGASSARTGTPAEERATGAPQWPVALALVVGLLIGGAAWAWLGGRAAGPAAGGQVGLSIPMPVNLALQMSEDVGAFAVTPDGRRLVFKARTRAVPGEGLVDADYRLYVRPLDSFDLRAIPGTDFVSTFTISPDSQWLAATRYLSEEASEMEVVKLPLDGSAPAVRLADWDRGWGESLVWLADGDLLAANETTAVAYRLPSAGGAWREVGPIETGGVSGYPQFHRTIADEGGVLMSLQSWGQGGFQLDQWWLDTDTLQGTRLIENAGRAVLAPSGELVFSRGDTLLAAPFNREQLSLAGEVRAIASGLRTAASWSPGEFVLAQNGTLVYLPGSRAGLDRRLIIIDEAGNTEEFAPELRAFDESPALTADGRRAAVVAANTAGTFELWLADRGRPGLTRAVALPGADATEPVLSPDGRWLVYTRNARDLGNGLFLHRVGENEPPLKILGVERLEQYPVATGITPDRTGVIVMMAEGRGTADILFVPLGADGEPGQARSLISTPRAEWSGTVSRDGRWFAWASDESGKPEAWVTAWDGTAPTGPALRVSTGVVDRLVWGANGRLFFNEEPARLMSVDVSATPTLSASAPRLVHDLDLLRVYSDFWHVMPDNRIFAIQDGESESDVSEFRVVLNWTGARASVSAAPADRGSR